MNIPISKPFFGEEERRILVKPLESGWVVQGPYVELFENAFSAFTQARHSIATSSCTAALHIAVAALGLGPGDEVIVPAFTWISTANVVEFMGARPVFCDVDLLTYNIAVDQIESLITPRTVGIIPVHLFGLCAEMEKIQAIAERHHLWVLEDAACALGGSYKNRHAGTFGDAGCFSFHPRKSVTTGEGGMITTNRAELEPLARCLRDHGASRSDLSRHHERAGFLLAEYKLLGYNYRMTDIQGALGCAQMDRFEWILAERRRRARRYDEILNEVVWLQKPVASADCLHAYQAYVCLFRPEVPSLQNVRFLHERRNDLMSRLEQAGIATRQGTHAPVILDYYLKKYRFRFDQFPNAYLADRLTLTLPLYVQMTDDEQDAVCRGLKEHFDAKVVT